MNFALNLIKKRIQPEQLFMISVLIVNGGNYLYNLFLGRYLGPEKFADAAILITFLLVLSFVAMTFQLVTAKFSVELEGESFANFLNRILQKGLITSILLGLTIIVFAANLQTFFKTSTSSMFVVFGLGVPFYFLMSINRGYFQGKKLLNALSLTYQSEMLTRLLVTFAFLFLFDLDTSIIIALGILISFILGLFPLEIKRFSLFKNYALESTYKKQVKNFFIITAFYELTQIIINNSDILLVKHYFSTEDAGLYASLALIGRVVYFIAWMFVMLLLPTVIQLKKEGKSTLPVLLKYLLYIAGIATTIIVGCYFFPTQVINILFGDAYLSMAPLLWKYALATGIFALSNIFAYYYLSLENYVPVVISGLFGMLQVGLIVFYHNSLSMVVHVQIVIMIALFILQLLFFFISNIKLSKV